MSSVLHCLSDWAKETPTAATHRFKLNGEWKSITAREVCDRIYWMALFLESKGISSKDVSAIYAYNSPEWIQTELAMLLLGGKSAGIYPNSTQKDILYILNHTEATVLGIQNKDYFEKLTLKDPSIIPDRIKIMIVFDGDTSISSKAVSFEKALEEGKKLAAGAGVKKYEDFLNRIDPRSGAFLIYTSGTTGNPKGALLSHDNIYYTAKIAAEFWELPFAVGSTFSFLPLCHVAEKIQNVGVAIVQRLAVNFCTKFDNVSTELPEVQPTLLLCVPRLWEKMMEGVLNKLNRADGVKKKMGLWALEVGAKVAEAKYAEKMPNPIDLIQLKVAEKLVLSKIRFALGLGHAKVLASGAAALPAHVSKWFRSLGLEILEDFGQTESTGVICMTLPGKECSGTVGKPVPGVEFKIAEDGEVMTKGRHVFVSYFKDDAATQATLEQGWLHTGDLGEFDSRGYVKIRGRKKEIMKTSGGKMVAPLPIEERIKSSDMISQVCMVGDGRKYLSALITLTEKALDEFKSKINTSQAFVDHPEVLENIKRHIEEVNRELASYEQIKRFTVLSREFSIVDGEMTPTLKMKRNIIESRYRDLIEKMYNER